MDGEGWTPVGEKIFRELEKLNKLLAQIGYEAENSSEKNGADVCSVAAWNEFGTINMPSRPFMRKSVDDNKDEISAYMRQKVEDVLSGRKTAEQVFKEIGLFQKGLIQKKITDGSFEPNAPSTIRRKKSDKPLIDTGRMRQSVEIFIEKK